ncbi:MAG: hypothetical protein LLG01_11805 [Planctomycetaceae bacterium]|nr:hypothetical protein [Planctomycetaceae bacterium]
MKRLPKPSAAMVLAVLMACAFLTALPGRRVAEPLRNVTSYLFVPPGEGAMYFVSYFKGRITARAPRPIGADEARALEAENTQLRQQVYSLVEQRDQWWRRATIISGLRKQFGGRFGPSQEFPYDIIPAWVAGDESLPYGSGRSLGTRHSVASRKGAPVTSWVLKTDRTKAIEPVGSPAIAVDVESKHRYLLQITGSVLVGRLTQTADFTARMQLVSDANFSIQARIRRLVDRQHPRTVRPKGSSEFKPLTADNSLIDVQATGDGKGSVIVEGIWEGEDVRARGWLAPGEAYSPELPPRRGDQLVTRADEMFMPAEVLVGEVVEVTPIPEHGGFVRLRVEPAVNLAALREVYIVVPRGATPEAAP